MPKKDWFDLLPMCVRRWLIGQFLVLARQCPEHRQGESIHCVNCGLRMDAIQRAQELGAFP